MPLGLNNSAEKKRSVRESDDPPSESVMADVCLGITVKGLCALVAMGLTIVFMWRAIAERDVYGAPWAARFTPRSFFLWHGGKERALSDSPGLGPQPSGRAWGWGAGLGAPILPAGNSDRVTDGQPS